MNGRRAKAIRGAAVVMNGGSARSYGSGDGRTFRWEGFRRVHRAAKRAFRPTPLDRIPAAAERFAAIREEALRRAAAQGGARQEAARD